jgi:hypothetical protein
MCDPPSAVCRECLPKALPRMAKYPFRWQNTCDACGACVERMHSAMVQLGHFSVNGHICPNCQAEGALDAALTADEIIPVGRNRPCACGSGRKYKHCHGRPQNGTTP